MEPGPGGKALRRRRRCPQAVTFEDRLSRALHRALPSGVAYADARLERSAGFRLERRDGKVDDAVPRDETGVGVRVLVGGRWGFASTTLPSRVDPRDLIAGAVRLARSIPGASGPARLAECPPGKGTERLPAARPASSIPIEEKAALLRDLERLARRWRETKTVTTRWSEGSRTTHLISSEGSDLRWTVPRTSVALDATLRSGSRHHGVRFRVAGTAGGEVLDDDDPFARTEEAMARARQVLRHGTRCPTGRFTVVIDPELTGVFTHEAVGHGLEADLVVAGDSLLEGRRGTRIAVPGFSVVDDPTIPRAFGSFPFDDEGVPAQRKLLVDRGILRDYITSREYGARLRRPTNGGARADSWESRPLVRMSNVLVLPGDATLDELLEGADGGIFARGSRGGQVDTARGTFQFTPEEAWRIEDGEIGRPVRDCALTGSVLRTLRRITGIGKESRLGGPGFCGKGQWVPVSDGGPHLQIEDVLVGGG